MEDEEKAEITREYLNNTFKQTEENQLAIMIGSKCFYEGLEKGLAEGKPKWHDLRKDPNDLPKGDEDCLCFISGCYFVGHYAKEDKEWHFDEFISNGVIAWCELPKFEEK